MDRNLALEFMRATEAAAIGAARWVGKGDKNAADDAAVQNMRKVLNSIDFSGKIVIGEGEMDEAPMLYIGEEVGKGNGMKIDLAVDPLECTNSVAYGRPNAICVLAAAPEGSLLHAPDMYMNKIAVGPEAVGKIDLDKSVAENVKAVAKALGKEVKDVTIIILERERHNKIVEEARKAGARIRFITDGDISGAIAPCMKNSGVDMLLGIGAAPEGVIAASAIKCHGGEMQGRLHFTKDEEKKRVIKMGIKDPNKKFHTDDLVKGDRCQFVATGVCEGPLVDGVQFTDYGAITHSVVMRKNTGTIRYVQTHHKFEKDPTYD